VKSTGCNLRKAGHGVKVLSDCVTRYGGRKIAEMLAYCAGRGREIIGVKDL